MLLPILIAFQAIAPAPAAPAVPGAPERFSILAPTPCRSPQVATDESGKDIVVCATAESSQRLPLPAERGPPDRPLASNPDLDGAGALAAGATPCGATQWGCQTGVNVFGGATAAVRLVQKLVAPDSCCEDAGESTNPMKLVSDIGRAFKRKPARSDKADRVPIDLREPPLTTARATP